MPQPLIAFFEHLADKLPRALKIVVQMQKQHRKAFMALLQVAQRVPRRLAIQVIGLLGNLRHRPETRQPRHAASDGGT